LIIQGLCDSFKQQLLQAVHNFDSDVIKLAMYDASSCTLTPSTTVYSSTGEVTGTGYVAGGQTLTSQTVSSGQGVAWVDWADPSYTGANFSADGALIYNSTRANKAIMVLNFGTTRYFSGNTSLILPSPTSTSALLRLD